MTDRQAKRFVALLAGAGLLVAPRRTRPLAGFVYGLTLSRAQGASRDHLERTLLRLFSERTAVTTKVDALAARVAELDQAIAHGSDAA